MSAIFEQACYALDPEKMKITWEIGECGVTGEPTAVVAVEFADGSLFQTNPDAARALGIALIEASGLALGAWGQRQREAAKDAALLADPAPTLADFYEPVSVADLSAAALTRYTTLKQWDEASAAAAAMHAAPVAQSTEGL